MKSIVIYRTDIWKFNKSLDSKLRSMEMDFLKDLRDNED